MNDPQIWTLIGVFAAVMLGGMTLMTTLLGRTIRSEGDRVNARFDTVDVKIGHLDRDVAHLMHRAWGEPSAE